MCSVTAADDTEQVAQPENNLEHPGCTCKVCTGILGINRRAPLHTPRNDDRTRQGMYLGGQNGSGSCTLSEAQRSCVVEESLEDPSVKRNACVAGTSTACRCQGERQLGIVDKETGRWYTGLLCGSVNNLRIQVQSGLQTAWVRLYSTHVLR